MRKFRFIGDPEDYEWKVKPVIHDVYDWERFKKSHGSLSDDDYFMFIEYHEDWQEVFEEPAKTLHKDTDLGYFAGLFIQAHIQNYRRPDIDASIFFAKELIQKLDQETK